MADDVVALGVFHFKDNRPNFEDLSGDNGFHFWLASKVMEVLGYTNITNIKNAKPIQRALTACNTLGIPVQENFEFLDDDVKLTRFACYLVAMNADPKKPQVAAAQAYFATLAEQFSKYAQDNEDDKKSELGTDNLPDSVLADFVNDQTDYMLDLYRDEAQKLSREFLDATYESELSEAVQRLDSQYREKYDELAKSLRPHLWWYGVGQSIAASFFFVLAGYVILKMSGSWDILLGSLFK